MGLPVFYNIKDVNLALSTNVPNYTSFEAIDGGLEEDSSIAIEYAGTQVERKSDATGKNYQYSFKNDRAVDLTLALQHGGPLHKWFDRAYTVAEATLNRKMVVTGSFIDPVLEKTVAFQGAIEQRPNTTFASTLQSVSLKIVAHVLSDVPKTL